MPTPTSPVPPARHRRLLHVLLATALVVGAAATGGSAATAAAPAPTPPVTFSTAPDAPSRYQGQVSCAPGETPGAAALRELLRTTYGRANAGGSWRACGQGGTSEHKEGRAYDWMLDVSDPAQKALADGFLTWLVGPDSSGVAAGNARRLGVQYVIWNRQTWQSWTGAWKPYTGSSPHTDHVHISLSWDGAFKRTSWWTGRAVTQVDRGPCQVYVGDLAPTYSGPTYAACPALTTKPSIATGPGMYGGQYLPAGRGLASPQGGMAAFMQADGNFVVYAPGGRPVWHTSTFGNPGARLVMQTDGNLVVYSADGRAVWHTRTSGNLGSRLVLQDDGNLVVYRADDRPTWASGTRA